MVIRGPDGQILDLPPSAPVPSEEAEEVQRQVLERVQQGLKDNGALG